MTKFTKEQVIELIKETKCGIDVSSYDEFEEVFQNLESFKNRQDDELSLFDRIALNDAIVKGYVTVTCTDEAIKISGTRKYQEMKKLRDLLVYPAEVSWLDVEREDLLNKDYLNYNHYFAKLKNENHEHATDNSGKVYPVDLLVKAVEDYEKEENCELSDIFGWEDYNHIDVDFFEETKTEEASFEIHYCEKTKNNVSETLETLTLTLKND